MGCGSSTATASGARCVDEALFRFPHGMLDPWFKRTYPLKHLEMALLAMGGCRVLRDAAARAFTSWKRTAAGLVNRLALSLSEAVVNYGTAAPQVDLHLRRA